jgi:hypothetical protein
VPSTNFVFARLITYGPPASLNQRSMSKLIATPASAAATPIETVSMIVLIVLRFAIRARPTPRAISEVILTRSRDEPCLRYWKEDKRQDRYHR